MKVGVSWLEEWLGTTLDPEPLAELLTMAGLEVDEMSPATVPMSGVVAGCVRHMEPHPEADRLKVCSVDAGGSDLLQVVCGAANVREGIYAPLAPAGARIGELEIGGTDIRGVASNGMLCSATELGLEEDSPGLLELDAEIAAGTDLVEYLGLADTVLVLDLTPNRADCFSILGLAREIAALRGSRLNVPRQHPVAPTHERSFPVQVAEPSACPRYLARVACNLNGAARTPLWMRERLRRGGVRALHPVVDVLNYVMLELGQPMHAFDLDRIDERIEVRYARSGEQLELLGGVQVEAGGNTLLIADAQGPLALAGVIGGAASAVSPATRNVLIECAFFAPDSIMGRARSYGLHTESSLRFERGVDPTLQHRAVERACELLERITGGEFGPVTETAPPPAPAQPIALRYDTLVRRLGVEIARGETSRMLTRVGCRMKPCRGGWLCTPPPHRFDLKIEEDLIGETGRLYGYGRIAGGGRAAVAAPRGRIEDRGERNDGWCDRLVERGYSEVITYSFVEPGLLEVLSGTPVVALSNPISPATSVMRTSLWAGLLTTLVHGLNRQRDRVRIFELGRCFGRQDERLMLAGLACGAVCPEQWGEPSRACDFYDLKGDVHSLFTADPANLSYERSASRGLHPDCAADILLGGRCVGRLGALDPAVAQRLGITRDVFLFEIDCDVPPLPAPVQVEPVSRYPSVRRDVSLTVPVGVSAGQILDCIRGLGIELLQEIVFFDLYQGEKTEEGSKSMALGLIFQDISSTLNDRVCTELVDEIVTALARSLKINLRI